MVRSLTSRVVFVLAIAAALAAVEQPTRGADAEPAKKASKKHHRLPSHYGDVVTQEQREKIYKIQDDFGPKIDAIEAQLKTVKKEQNDKIASLLTPEQKKQIQVAEAKAKEEKAKKKADAKAEKNVEKKTEKKAARKANAVAPPADKKPAK